MLALRFVRRYSTNLKRSERPRVDILSTQLCDLAIQRLAPSLEQYRGCDLIDYNPGQSVWSSKLNDQLKPKRHILLEPDDSYSQHLQPLIDRGAIRLTGDGSKQRTWDDLQKHRLLPEKLARNDPKRFEPNRTLLVVGNMAVREVKTRAVEDSLLNAIASNLLESLAEGKLAQSYGRVRLLLWMTDSDRRLLLPSKISNRRRLAIMAETVSTMNVVVSGQDSPDRARRDPQLELQRAMSLLQRNTGNLTRKHVWEQLAADALRLPDPATYKIPPLPSIERPWITEHKQLEAAYLSGEFPAFAGGMTLPEIMEWNRSEASTTHNQKKGVVREYHPSYKRLLSLRSQVKAEQKREDLIAAALAGEQVANLHTPRNYARYLQRQDDRKAFTEKLLLHDQARYLPLFSETNDFNGSEPLSLVEVQPHAPPELLDPGFYLLYTRLLSALTAQSVKPLPDALAAIRPQAESLATTTDRVRTIPVSLFLALTTAWRQRFGDKLA